MFDQNSKLWQVGNNLNHGQLFEEVKLHQDVEQSDDACQENEKIEQSQTLQPRFEVFSDQPGD